MQLDASIDRQLVVDRLADERVGEREARRLCRRPRRRDAPPIASSRAASTSVSSRSDAFDERIQRERATTHRRDREHVVRRVVQVLQAAADHFAHALRDRDAPTVGSARRVEPPVCGEQPYHLRDEERIAFCLARTPRRSDPRPVHGRR